MCEQGAANLAIILQPISFWISCDLSHGGGASFGLSSGGALGVEPDAAGSRTPPGFRAQEAHRGVGSSGL